MTNSKYTMSVGLACDVPPKGWYCTRKRGHSGPCAAWPLRPALLQRLRNWWSVCRKYGHQFFPEGSTLGGEWIRCYNCWKLDEYLPGVHEPKGYLDAETEVQKEG